jgi:hypothetical protein
MNTSQDIYNFVVSILNYSPDTTFFDSFLSLSQSQRETSRAWMYLRKVDQTQKAYVSATSTYLTPLNLPSDFRRWYAPKRSIQLVANDGITFRWYVEIPMDRRLEYKDDNTKFYCDYANQKLYLCGIVDQTYTVNQFYQYKPVTLTYLANNSWVFPSEYLPILGYDVAARIQLGADYDVVNAAQANANIAFAAQFYNSMAEWDDSLQSGSIEGVEYPSDNIAPPFYSKVIPSSNG